MLLCFQAANQLEAHGHVTDPSLRVDAQEAADGARVEHQHGRAVLISRARQDLELFPKQ